MPDHKGMLEAEVEGLEATDIPYRDRGGIMKISDLIVERCAKRIEAYALSLELQRHIGLPGPIIALEAAAQKIRELSIEARGRPENSFERLSGEAVLIDGRLYRQMTDDEAVDFTWGVEHDTIGTLPFEPEAVKAYLDSCIRYWRAHVGNPACKIARVYVDVFQSVRMSLFGELLPVKSDGEEND